MALPLFTVHFFEWSYEWISIARDERSIRGVRRKIIVRDHGGINRKVSGTWNHPNIDDLNGLGDRDFSRVGVQETIDDDDRDASGFEARAGDDLAERFYERLRERGVRGRLVIDVRDETVRGESRNDITE